MISIFLLEHMRLFHANTEMFSILYKLVTVILYIGIRYIQQRCLSIYILSRLYNQWQVSFC